METWPRNEPFHKGLFTLNESETFFDLYRFVMFKQPVYLLALLTLYWHASRKFMGFYLNAQNSQMIMDACLYKVSRTIVHGGV